MGFAVELVLRCGIPIKITNNYHQLVALSYTLWQTMICHSRFFIEKTEFPNG